MKTICLALALLVAACATYPPMADMIAVDGSLCEAGETFCDPVEKMYRSNAQEYLGAIASGKPPPKTDPARALGLTPEERRLPGIMPNARTMGLDDL